MNFLTFILSFSLLALLTSLFINGWYKVTRHYIVVQPDNIETVEGYVLKWWSYWIEKVKRQKKVFYVTETLHNKYQELQRLLPKVSEKLDWDGHDYLIRKRGDLELTEEDFDKIERVLRVEIAKQSTLISFYIEEPIYRLPSWVRNPLSQCVVCMSSVYGSISYFAFVFLVNGAFDWTSHKKIAIIALYSFFLLILTVLTSFIARKID